MKTGLIKYLAIFIYGMGLLITLSNKEHSRKSVASNGFKTKARNSTEIKEKVVTAQKFFSSNERFTIRFSDNEFSFLY